MKNGGGTSNWCPKRSRHEGRRIGHLMKKLERFRPDGTVIVEFHCQWCGHIVKPIGGEA